MKYIKINFAFFCALFMFPFGAGAQNNQIPQGKWELESIYAFENGVKLTPFSAENLNFAVPTEIDVKSNEITLTSKKEGSITKNYNNVVYGNLFCFLPCVEWTIENSSLRLQWFQAAENLRGELKGEITVVLTYSIK